MQVSTEQITPDYTALRIISPAYAGRSGELTAILQYVYQSMILSSCGKVEEGKLMMRLAKEEMEHLEILGKLLCKLGAPPMFTSCPPYPVGHYSASAVDYSRELRAMIQADIAGERAAIGLYRAMLCHLNNERVSEIIASICADEEEHLAKLERLLTRV